jgi:glycosyltransferase involved in cell wall biosynthesis
VNKEKAFIILSPGFPENRKDTTCLPFLQNFVRTFGEKNPNLPLIILSFIYPFQPGEYSFEGAQVIAFGNHNKGYFSHKIHWIQNWKCLKKLHNKFEIRGILSLWLGECALIGHFFSKFYGINHLIWILGQDAKPKNPYQRLIRPKSSELIAISNFIQNEYHRNYGVRPQFCVPIGIDPGLFSKENHSTEFDIMGAGSLIPLKQYSYFIKIIKELSQTHPGLRAVICGNGPELDLLMGLRKSLGLENNLEIYGELPYTKTLEFMQKSKIFLHTSNYEGFAQVILEALYAGAQVVSWVEPMKAPFEHWEIIRREEDMIPTLNKLLNLRDPIRKSIFPYSIQGTVQNILDLYP